MSDITDFIDYVSNDIFELLEKSKFNIDILEARLVLMMLDQGILAPEVRIREMANFGIKNETATFAATFSQIGEDGKKETIHTFLSFNNE